VKCPRLIIIFSIFFACTLQAQNLVPNPGFEEYNNCPPDRSAIVYSPDYSVFPTAKWWVSALYNTTPDYYHTCATNPLVTLPKNTYNDYQAPRGGNACAGFSMMSGFPKQPELSDYREYLETKLTQPLEAGKRYYVSYFVNMTYHLPDGYVQLAIDMAGARLTDTQLNFSYPFSEPLLFLPGPPDVFNPRNTFITDTASWTKIGGLYTAHGGEQWLTLGYFKDSLPINTLLIYSPVPDPDSIHVACYMNIDDVCVTKVSPSGHDTIYTDAFPLSVTGTVHTGSHIWSTGDTTTSIVVTGPGTHWVTNTNDCFYKADTITVICNVDSIFTHSEQYTDAFPATISGSVQSGTHLWYNGDSTGSIIVSTPGTYWVLSTDDCLYRIDTITILCNEDTSWSDTIIYASSFPIAVTSVVTGDSLLWSTGGKELSITISASGIYSFVVWKGCKRYIRTILVEERTIDKCLWLPSAFTPNGDGRNDRFGPVYSCYTPLPYYELRIFNRFGECVFTTDILRETWDGTYKGAKQDVGTYYYMLRYSQKSRSSNMKMNGKDMRLLKGDLTLIR
jgi:gliding motility-associated-like protein